MKNLTQNELALVNGGDAASSYAAVGGIGLGGAMIAGGIVGGPIGVAGAGMAWCFSFGIASLLKMV